MKVTEKSSGDGAVILEAVATKDEVNKVLDMCGARFCAQMNIPPVPNMTPAQAARESLGIEDLDETVGVKALEALVPLAMDKVSIIPAYNPTPTQKSALVRNKPCSFEARVVPRPTYELTSYEPVSITVLPRPDVTPYVDHQISQIALQHPEFITAEPRPLKSEDDCVIAVDCKRNGEQVNALTTDRRAYTVGANLMPEEFDRELIDMKPGETKSFSYTAPSFDDDGNEIEANYECEVTLLEIQKRVPPVINDEWIKRNMPGFESLEDLRTRIANTAREEMEVDYQNYLRATAATELAKRFEGKIADDIYEATMRDLLNDLQTHLAQQGIEYKQYVEQNGGEQQFGMQMMLETRRLLQEGYAIDALYRHEGLKFSDADMIEICLRISQGDPQYTKRQMEEQGMRLQLRESAKRICANKWLVEHAQITEREQSAE